MNRQRVAVTGGLWLLLAVLSVGGSMARADALLVAPPVVTIGPSTGPIERSEVFSGTTPQSFVLPVSVTAPGTIQITLTDLDWPQRLAALSFAATTSTQVLARSNTPGVLSFFMASAGNFSAEVFGTTSGSLAMGLFGMRIDYAPVPLPAGVWLLLSGLMALCGCFRQRAPLAGNSLTC